MDLRLYYPTQWRKNIGDLAEPKDKNFSWFICAKKYLDPILHVNVIEIRPGYQFYRIESGETFEVRGYRDKHH